MNQNNKITLVKEVWVICIRLFLFSDEKTTWKVYYGRENKKVVKNENRYIFNTRTSTHTFKGNK